MCTNMFPSQQGQTETDCRLANLIRQTATIVWIIRGCCIGPSVFAFPHMKGRTAPDKVSLVCHVKCNLVKG